MLKDEFDYLQGVVDTLEYTVEELQNKLEALTDG